MKRRIKVSALDDLDMVLDPRPISKEESRELDEFFRARKEKRKQLGLEISYDFLWKPRPLTEREKFVLAELDKLEKIEREELATKYRNKQLA